MKWKNFIAQIPRRFRESYTNGIAQQTGMSMKEIKPVFKSGRCEHNCVYVTVKYCATQEFIFESCLLKTRVVNLTFTNKHIYHSCTHLSLFPPTPNRPMEVPLSMEALHTASSPTHSRAPSPPSPPCTSLPARWAAPPTTTWPTPSSPWYAAACLSELPPSFIQSKWV